MFSIKGLLPERKAFYRNTMAYERAKYVRERILRTPNRHWFRQIYVEIEQRGRNIDRNIFIAQEKRRHKLPFKAQRLISLLTCKKGYSFLNAQKMRELYPERFQAPAYEDLQALGPGDYVQVCAVYDDVTLMPERFWVEIKTIFTDTDMIVGTVNNDLVFDVINDGDQVIFGKKNILKIY